MSQMEPYLLPSVGGRCGILFLVLLLLGLLLLVLLLLGHLRDQSLPGALEGWAGRVLGLCGQRPAVRTNCKLVKPHSNNGDRGLTNTDEMVSMEQTQFIDRIMLRVSVFLTPDDVSGR